MKTLVSNLSLTLAIMAGLISSAFGQSVKYEFTAGSMEPTVTGLPAGVIASGFSLGAFTLAGLQDNGGGPAALRISGNDVQDATGTSFSTNKVLSFSLTIPNGVVLDLTSMSLGFTSTGMTGAPYSNSRVFSNLTTNNPTNVVINTIGVLGKTNGGAESGTSSISLATPDSNGATNGTAVNNGMFDNLTNQTLTFFLPWIDTGSATTTASYIDIDNVTLTFEAVATPPAEPITSFTAAAISPTEVLLAWNETLANETGFVIERGVSGSGVWKPVITVAANVTAIRDLGVEPGVGYLYRITASLAGGGSSSTAISGPVTVPAVASRAPLIILPVGDSITEGQGAAGGYRDPLFTFLSNAGLPTKYVGSWTSRPTTVLTNAGQASHEGHGSYATTLITGNLDGLLNPVALPYGTPPDSNNGGFWLTGISGRAAVYPDVILLLIGANDMGMFQRTAAQTLQHYDALLTKLVTLRPAAQILCSTVLPYNGALYPTGKDYSQREANNLAFSQMLPALVSSYQADGYRVRLYDMRQKINPANASTLLAADGVHPNQAGYQAIAAGWFEAIQQLPLIESWRTRHFGAATGRSADLADPDGDAAVNLLEYAFGTDPLAAGPALPLTTTVGADHAAITFPRRRHADVRYVVEISTDLAADSWSEDTVQAGSPVSLSPDFEQVTFRDRQPRSAHSKRFMRVKILKP